MVHIFFKTFGCQANVADSEGLITYLKDLGCATVDTPEKADLIIVNSCAIRAKAEQKMFSYVGELVPYKRQKPYLRIGIIGCVASYRKKEMYERFSHINFVFGAREDMRTFHSYLVDIITALETTKQFHEVNPDAVMHGPGQDRDIKKIVVKKALVPSKRRFAPVMLAKLGAKISAPTEVKKSYINIMTGCNNYCSYCIVPFTRGREQSYSMQSIVDRVTREVKDGAKEVTLIGQNVNSYVDPDTEQPFDKLLEAVAKIDGEFWVRYISPHPKDMTKAVLDVMAAFPEKLCHWIHLPLQSGSDTILEVMKRTYTVERYMQIVHWIRERMPHATITTDIIVGFPGETKEDYEGTRAVMEAVKYDLIYSFIYSRRKYTTAYRMGDPTPHELKQERLEGLQERNKELSLERNSLLIGRICKVLVEKRLTHGKLLARTTGNVRVLFDGPDECIGSFLMVQIESAGPAQVEGSLVQPRVRTHIEVQAGR